MDEPRKPFCGWFYGHGKHLVLCKAADHPYRSDNYELPRAAIVEFPTNEEAHELAQALNETFVNFMQARKERQKERTVKALLDQLVSLIVPRGEQWTPKRD